MIFGLILCRGLMFSAPQMDFRKMAQNEFFVSPGGAEPGATRSNPEQNWGGPPGRGAENADTFEKSGPGAGEPGATRSRIGLTKKYEKFGGGLGRPQSAKS